MSNAIVFSRYSTSLSGAQIYWASVGFLILPMAYLGFAFPMVPDSDFKTYWESVLTFDRYVKGGGLLFLLLPFKALGFSAGVSATLLNGFAWVLFAFGIRPHSGNFYQALYCSWVALIFGILWIPMIGFVDSVFSHIGFLVFGLRLFYDSRENDSISLVSSLFLIGVALSIRMQMVLVFLGAIVVVLPLTYHFSRYRKFLWLLIPIFAAIGLEKALGHGSSRQGIIALHQRTPLYAGLLAAYEGGRWCGGWSPKAAALADQEMSKSLVFLFHKYLEVERLPGYLATAKCKLKRLITTDSLLIHFLVTVNKKYDSNHQLVSKRQLLDSIEKWSFFLLKISLFLGLIALCFANTSLPVSLFAVALVFSYTVVFAIFEFNPRYVIPFWGLVSFLLLYRQDPTKNS